MPHTDNRMQTHWNEVREFILKNWPKFTPVELERIDGDYDVFLDYLKEYYGGFPLTEAIARNKLQGFFNSLDNKEFIKK